MPYYLTGARVKFTFEYFDGSVTELEFEAINVWKEVYSADPNKEKGQEYLELDLKCKGRIPMGFLVNDPMTWANHPVTNTFNLNFFAACADKVEIIREPEM